MWANLLNPLQNLASATTSVINPQTQVCDSECQKRKKLIGLKVALDAKEATKAQDPIGYEKARIAYYTELNGQGWLATEKERIVKEEITPKITSYTQEYDQLVKDEISQKKMFDFMTAIQAEQVTDDEQLKYLQKSLIKDNVTKNVLNRLYELNDNTNIVTTQTSNYIVIILDVVMVILGLIIVYMIYKKFDKIMGYNRPTMPIGGKRVPH